MKKSAFILLLASIAFLTRSFGQAPEIVVVNNGSHMCGGQVVLSAICNKGTISWYASATNDTAIATGTFFITPHLSASYTYYAEASFEGIKSVRLPVTATIIQCSDSYWLGEWLKGKWYHTRTTGGYSGIDETEPIIIGNYTEIEHLAGKDSVIWNTYENCRLVFQKHCKIGYQYFDDWNWRFFIEGPDELNVILLNGNDFSIGMAEASDQFFYFYSRADNPAFPLIPQITQVMNGWACEGESVTMSAFSNKGSVNWFASDTGGTALAMGTEFTTRIDRTTVFYAEANDEGCTSSKRVLVNAVISENCEAMDSVSALIAGRWYVTGVGKKPDIFAALIPVAGDSVVMSRVQQTDSIAGSFYHQCEITQRRAYRLVWDSSVAMGSKTWMLVNTGNISERFIMLANDTTLTLGVDFVNGQYMVFAKIDTFALMPMPAIINTYEDVNRRCGPGSVSLQAQANTGLIRWYNSAEGGEILGMGTVYFTPSITETTTWYTDVISNDCVTNQRTAIAAVITEPPQVSTVVHGARCGEGKVLLSATANMGIIQWYSAVADEIPLAAGSEYETPTLQSTTTYYVEAFYEGCVSDRAAITASIVTGDTCTTGLEHSEDQIALYPNPTNGIINLPRNEPVNEPVTFEILSSSGEVLLKQVVQATQHSWVIDLAGFNPGVFILRVIQKDKTRSYKVIKE